MLTMDPNYGVDIVHDVIREAESLSEETVTLLTTKYKMCYV